MKQERYNPNRIVVRYTTDNCSVKEPVYSSQEAAGADISSTMQTTLAPGEHKVVTTGVYLELSPGFVGYVHARSGMAANHGVTVLNGTGVIDSDYRGELKVILINHGKKEYAINTGDRIAQLIIVPSCQAIFVRSDKIDETDRGQGGLGSTGT